MQEDTGVSIRLLEPTDIPAAKALWKQAFGDSDAFINTYFKNKVSEGESLGYFDGGLKSVLHMLPYTIKVQGELIASAYIAGAATDAACRGQGLMRKMLLASLERMRGRGILMTHLYPFKHSFYEQFGWAAYSYVRRIKAAGAGEKNAHVVETIDEDVLRPLYERMTQNMDGCVVRGEREWRWRLDELFSDGGKVVVLNKHHVPAAYMMILDNEGSALSIETVYFDEQDTKTLADWLLTQGYSAVKYNLVSQNEGKPHGMVRVVDARALLETFGAVELLDQVRITDGFAQWNNTGSKEAEAEMDVSTLAQLVSGTKASWRKDNAKVATIYAEQKLFQRRTTCIFEEY